MTDSDLLQRNNYARQLVPHSISLTILVADALALACAYHFSLPLVHGIATYIFQSPAAYLNPHDLRERLYFFSALSMLVLIAFANKGHYTRRVPWWGQVNFILKAVFLALVFDGFSYFSQQLPFSRLMIVANWLLAFGFLLIGRQIVFLILAKRRQWQRPTVLIADNQTAIDCFHAFSADGHTGYKIHTILLRDQQAGLFNVAKLPREEQDVEIITDPRAYENFISQYPENFYIISIEGFRGRERDLLMKMLEKMQVDYAIIPSIKRVHLYGMEPHYFFGNDVMLLHTRNFIYAPLGRFFKRLLDITVSGCALLALLVMLPVVIVAKRIEGSDSPIFYGGVRVGMNGKLFPCWKFCTMRRDADQILGSVLENDPEAKAEWEKYQKLRNDPRIDSRISKLLRKTSLDELPQLWNVFIGDMSLVGPRPILESQKQEYGDALRQYLSVRPGLTGLWQVSGRNETSFEQRINWDSWYIRNWSVWHDIVILIKTAKVLITGSGAY